jgi:hypothetical protein
MACGFTVCTFPRCETTADASLVINAHDLSLTGIDLRKTELLQTVTATGVAIGSTDDNNMISVKPALKQQPKFGTQ